MKHLIYKIPILLASLFAFISCASSSFEIPVVLDHRKILVPPNDGIPVHQAGMTDITKIDPSLAIDLKYKTTDNFTGRALYPSSFPALLRPKTAARLWYANSLVKEQGYRILVWDAYRPQATQIALWEASGKNPQFVADPYNNPSLHTHGVAVDVTLVYVDGSPAPMPTKFDDFTKKASPHYFHPNPIVRRNLRILKDAMQQAGFQYIHAEWWHFLDRDYKQYDIIESIK